MAALQKSNALGAAMAMRLVVRWTMQQLKEQRAMLSSNSTFVPFFLQETAETGLVTCGRGDKKTKKGKRFKGSYGNSRPKREKKVERIKDRIEVPSYCRGKLEERRKEMSLGELCEESFRRKEKREKESRVENFER
ncbi:hypothetical protein HPP92_008881 [Vanilla planifolia]|uniref:30S ribosomal protein S31, mitochondrial n=1 Tax=Vanilla planifolia TaxID=51239 RepID=A0A835REK8_VANPL|nr:hypothetical protein HPP92_008881 [Vanilla planifolia]